MQIISKADQIEEQQIQYQLDKHNSSKQDIVIKQKQQKVFCHSCMERTEIISKKFFYRFTNGKIGFFCNEQEKKLWIGIYKLGS